MLKKMQANVQKRRAGREPTPPPALEVNKPLTVFIFIGTLNNFWRENKGAMNRLVRKESHTV